jgi:predicted DNA-binding protein (MmcQ/YjbR family)
MIYLYYVLIALGAFILGGGLVLLCRYLFAKRRIADKLAAKDPELVELVVAAGEAFHEYAKNHVVTRKEIAEATRAMDNPDIKVVERLHQPQLPMSLRVKDKTYAMLHGTDGGVMMTVKISDEYANMLGAKYHGVSKASFPCGLNWYYIPVDNTFSRDSVFEILYAAAEFTSQKREPAPRKRKVASG